MKRTALIFQSAIFCFCALPVGGFAENPICDNTEAANAFYEKCLATGESEFLRFSKEWPTFSNGEAFDSTGGIRWDSQTQLLPESEKRFSKNGVIYSLFKKGVY